MRHDHAAEVWLTYRATPTWRIKTRFDHNWSVDVRFSGKDWMIDVTCVNIAFRSQPELRLLISPRRYIGNIDQMRYNLTEAMLTCL